MAGDDGTVAGLGKQPFPAKPILTRMLCAVSVFAIQYLVIAPIITLRHWQQRRNPPESYPNLIKTYPSRPRLPIRVFFPKSYQHDAGPGSEGSRQPLPTLFTIHGGGFVIGDPSDNDVWNHLFANQHNALVIALNYAKAPANAFPGPLSDLEAQITAIFADPELAPLIRKDKVGMAGFSAGGNLTMAISQFPAVRERITAGIVPIYPVLDFTIHEEQKALTRRYKPALGGFRGKPNDLLSLPGPAFHWSYINIGHDTRDPLLSPLWAERSALPRRIWLIGCELDMLGHDAWRTACRLAGKPVPGLEQRIGQEEPEASGKVGALIMSGDERFAWDVKNEDGEVRWLCVPDAPHGFDQPVPMGQDALTLEDAFLKRDQIIKEAGEWLFGQ